MINPEDIRSVLIIGMAGGLAKLTAKQLANQYPHLKITGVDSRSLKSFALPENVTFQQMRYSRGGFEKLFRDKNFDLVLHLGRMSHADSAASLDKRINLNVMGTNKILELCQEYKTKKVIILSTYHVYGALVDNPVFLKEDAPLRASFKYPELRDVTEMDQVATNWMWKNQNDIQSIVLRPCNIIGSQIRNTITQYLKTKYAPIPMDFNPMFQFIHEQDMAKILVQSIEKVPTGIYNIAPEDVVSLHEAKEIVGEAGVKVPITLLQPAARLVKTLWSFPDYLIDYIKFASIIDSSSMTKHLDLSELQLSSKKALASLK